MGNPRSDPAPGASSSRGSGEAAAGKGESWDWEAADGIRKNKKKNRASSPVLTIEGADVAGVETTSAWTGEKKTRFESSPTSMDLDMTPRNGSRQADKIHVTDHEREQGQIEGLDWNDAMFKEEIDSFFKTYRALPASDDDEAWAPIDGRQLKEMKLRFATYRIKAHHKMFNGEELSIAEIRNMYPPATLEEQGYFELYELDFKEWYFDPEYWKFARLEDYQRLALPNTGEYLRWGFFHDACSTLQSDQEFVYFWETLSSETEWIKDFVRAGPSEWKRIERVVFYHAVKIAKECTHIFTPLLHSGYDEYLWSVMYDNTWYKDFACLYFDIWKLVAKQKMSFKDALDQVKEISMRSLCCFDLESELKSDEEMRSGPITYNYSTYIAKIDENLTDDEAYKLITEAVKDFFPKLKSYYDYAKKKLDIAEEIGLIPSSPSSVWKNSSEVTTKTGLVERRYQG